MNSLHTKRCGRSIAGTCLIALSLLCLCVLYLSRWSGQGALLISAEAKEIDGTRLKAIVNQFNRDNTIDVIAHSYEAVSIANEKNACNGNATYLTASSALNFFGEFKMLEGRAFHEADEGKNYILIPESLAIELLGTSACVGKMLTVNEKRHSILGVYQDRAFVMDSLVYETYPPAFILGQDLTSPVFVAVMPVSPLESELMLSVVTQAFKGSGISDIEAQDLAYQVHHVKWCIKGIFCIGLLALWLRFRRRILKMRKAHKQMIASAFSQHYLGQAFRLSKWQLTTYVGGFLLTWLVLLAIGWLMFFDCIVPTRLIPPTFLLSDVLDQLKQVIHYINAAPRIQHIWVVELAWGERAVVICVCVLLFGCWLYSRKAWDRRNEQN